MPRVAFVTCAKFPDLHPSDAPLAAAFVAAGWTVVPAIWNDATFDWQSLDAALLRSPWDYYQHPADFAAWLDRIEALGLPLWNPPALVRWNLNKTYLRELAQRGITTLPTHWFEVGTDPTALPAILAQLGWDHVVLKPAISAGAWRTHQFRASDADQHIPALAEILTQSEALLQPFAPEIVEVGESSVFFFGGTFSHAVLKTPARGDYRVQPQYDSHITTLTPTSDHLRQAQAVVDAIPHPWLYARVDGVLRRQPDGSDQLLLMELEVIEPHLFLDWAPGAAERLVRAFVARVA